MVEESVQDVGGGFSRVDERVAGSCGGSVEQLTCFRPERGGELGDRGSAVARVQMPFDAVEHLCLEIILCDVGDYFRGNRSGSVKENLGVYHASFGNDAEMIEFEDELSDMEIFPRLGFARSGITAFFLGIGQRVVKCAEVAVFWGFSNEGEFLDIEDDFRKIPLPDKQTKWTEADFGTVDLEKDSLAKLRGIHDPGIAELDFSAEERTAIVVHLEHAANPGLDIDIGKDGHESSNAPIENDHAAKDSQHKQGETSDGLAVKGPAGLYGRRGGVGRWRRSVECHFSK